MSQPLLPRGKFRKNSRGISSLIAAIFMVIIILFMSFNVFTFTLFKNTQFRDAVDALNQMDQDSFSEILVTSHGNFSVTQLGTVQVRVTISNEGPVLSEVVRVWVVWKDGDAESHGHEELDISLSPGDSVSRSIAVTVPSALPGNGTSNGWLVTTRGNLVPIEKPKVVMAQVSEGIGSIKMDFDSFKYYWRHANDSITPWDEGIKSFQVPSGKELVFAILLGNLDPDGRTITLHSNSLIQIYSGGSSKSGVAEIVNIDNGEVTTPFNRIDLPYGKTDWIYFALDQQALTQIAGDTCAVNLLLFGTIGDQDYGQNIPFVSIHVT